MPAPELLEPGSGGPQSAVTPWRSISMDLSMAIPTALPRRGAAATSSAMVYNRTRGA